MHIIKRSRIVQGLYSPVDLKPQESIKFPNAHTGEREFSLVSLLQLRMDVFYSSNWWIAPKLRMSELILREISEPER
jgi:hypothetical protein